MSDDQKLLERIDDIDAKLKHMDEIDTVDKEQTWVEILIIVWLVVLSGLVFFKERGGDPHQQAIQGIENRILNVEKNALKAHSESRGNLWYFTNLHDSRIDRLERYRNIPNQ